MTLTPTQHVLLVDDGPKFRTFAAAGLRESGLGCTVAADGEEALAFFEAPADVPFDAILLDIMMPGLTGYGLGLAIAKASVESQGGRIAVDCSPSGGARFRMTFKRGIPA